MCYGAKEFCNEDLPVSGLWKATNGAKGGLPQATADENSVMFNAKQQSTFEDLKAEIEQRIAQPSTSHMVSTADELEKLAALRERGILTEEEFAAKKKQLLGL